MQLSRNFKALKIWTVIKEHGLEKYGRIVQKNIYQAQYLVKLIKLDSALELSAPAPMNIVCFRFISENSSSYSQKNLNKLNEEIIIQLHERGIAIPSYTTLQGNYVIRVSITNQRSRNEDFDLLVKSVKEIGNELLPTLASS